MVELEQFAEPFPTNDCTISGHGPCAAIDWCVRQTLMISFEMVVSLGSDCVRATSPS